jgi:signal transduction histidine kinase
MSKFIKNFHTQFLVDLYFSDPKRVLHIPKGTILLRQEHFNDRLYLVKRGVLRGYAVNPDGSEINVFRATPFMFVGVNSFFSTLKTMTNVIADEDSEVAYVSYKEAADVAGGNASLAEQFLPVIVNELTFRQQHAMEVAYENEKTLKKLIQSEKLASLGQMAAGIAHELNNAIAVLEKNTQWLSKQIATIIEKHDAEMIDYFTYGIKEGRNLSTSEVRARQKRYKAIFGISDDAADLLAQTSIPENILKEQKKKLKKIAGEISRYWDTGATLKDMLVAAHHATYVVKSVKELGAARSERNQLVDINETLHESLSLLQSDLRRISVNLHLEEAPPMIASAGELIQIWSNLIKNACESLAQAHTVNPSLRIVAETGTERLSVSIIDNGPGIPPEIKDKIFQPNVTTKKEGLSFGLGLGLTIVQRIVESYGGKISVESEPGRTAFIVSLPIGATNG